MYVSEHTPQILDANLARTLRIHSLHQIKSNSRYLLKYHEHYERKCDNNAVIVFFLNLVEAKCKVDILGVTASQLCSKFAKFHYE